MLLGLSKSDTPEVRANALQALAIAGPRADGALRAGLTDPNEGVQAIAAYLVGHHRRNELAPEVAPLVRSESPYVRASAAYALARCGRPDERAMTGIVDLLLTHPSPKVRSHCAVLLGELGEPSAIGPLREAAASPPARASQTEVRMMDLQIAEAMVRLGSEDQIEIVRAALYPSRIEDLEIAALATQILGELDDRASVDALINVTAYRQEQGGRPMSAEVRLGAAAALAKLGHPQGNFIAEEFKASMIPAIRAQAAHVYGYTGQLENLARLEASLSDPSPPVRAAAAAGILRISARSAGQ
jgi:HEAT repeat protein